MNRETRALIAMAGILVAAVVIAAQGVASIDRFHRISDRVAVGAQPSPEQIAVLSDAGFNGIINLREELEYNDAPQAHEARVHGMQFIRVPVSKENPSDAAVKKFLAETDEDGVYPLYIYCEEGHRAAAFWMIRRVVRDGWTVTDAQVEATKAGLEGNMLDFARDYIHRHGKAAPKAS